MKFILHCVSSCVTSSASSSSRSSNFSSSSSSSIAEHPPTHDLLKRGRLLAVSRSIRTSDWRPSLGAIYEDDDFAKEAERQSKQLIAAAAEKSDRIRPRKTKSSSAFHGSGLNLRSYRFDNDFGQRGGLSSMNSGFCLTPFMI